MCEEESRAEAATCSKWHKRDWRLEEPHRELDVEKGSAGGKEVAAQRRSLLCVQSLIIETCAILLPF